MANEITAITQTELAYEEGGVGFRGQLVWDAARGGPRPGVLVAPAFGGLGPFEIEQAHRLAALGYAALAVDYYGDAQRSKDRARSAEMMMAVERDRPVLARRMEAALAALAGRRIVDAGRIAAMGYCFGGKAVLDLARAGADIRGAIPIHGVYDPPPGPNRAIGAAVLVLHGWDDPLATPEQLTALARELDASGCADWQVLGFGQTGHAFTNPGANDKPGGMAYSRRASDRSWTALTGFLREVLA
ncbi:MAG: dienelactone hydrolase family protein [Rhodobacteraceae bacterium]|nr:dienelactone hydrolase family protein [Paracoccaceae bacterium]